MISLDNFLVANRKLKGWALAFSIAITWVWAPALFISGKVSFLWGMAGIFWFVFMNSLTLMLFGYFIRKVHKEYADKGYTLTQYVRDKLGNANHLLSLSIVIGLLAASFAIQLMASALLFELYLGISKLTTSIILSAIVIAYCWKLGIRASIFTDVLQAIFVYAGILFFVPYLIFAGGGWETLLIGLSKKSIFDPALLVSFGLVVTIGWFFHPYIDQTFWQRLFCMKKTKYVLPAFAKASLLFAIVPISFGIIGLVASGAGIPIQNTDLVNLETINFYFPSWAGYVLIVVLFMGLASTLDSIICAMSGLMAIDIGDKVKIKRHTLMKLGLIFISLAGIAIANIPGITILNLFLFYSVIKVAIGAPIFFTVKGIKLHKGSVFVGQILGIAIAIPLFILKYELIASIIAIFVSSVIPWIINKVIQIKSLPTHI
jgi:urea-proton symporter